MPLKKVTRRSAMAMAISATAGTMVARAQSPFPDRPIRLIVPYTPGASTDTIARLVARHMEVYLKQSVVVENKSGAGGTVGTGEAARAAADGYTIVFANVSTVVLNNFLFRNLNYSVERDLAPIAHIAYVPNILVINRDVPVTNLKELIEHLKKNPGRYSYGSAGQGTIMHISGELFKKLTGVEMVHVPYRGSLPALQDIIAGQILMMFDNIPGSIGLVKSNTLRPIGVSTDVRIPALPDVPTIAESGLPEFVNKSWFALYARAGTPQPIMDKLQAAALYAINQTETTERLVSLGAIPAPMNAQDTGKFWKSEIAYWGPIMKSLNITLD